LQQLGEGAIDNPESGWQPLRDRLQKDLYAAGGILPIQMRVVLRQLSSLRSLTVKAYENEGGVLGVAAQYVAEVADSVAKYASTDPTTVRGVLRELVNPADRSKTRDISLDLLANRCANTLDSTKFGRMLEQLKTEGMLRDRADESGARRWRLDHDFLALAIEELDRRENDIHAFSTNMLKHYEL